MPPAADTEGKSADDEFQAFAESLICEGWPIELLESSSSASFSSQAMTMKRGFSGTKVRVFLVWLQYTRGHVSFTTSLQDRGSMLMSEGCVETEH